MCVQNYLQTVQLIPYTQVNLCTKLSTQCAVKTLHVVNVCTKLPTYRAVNTLHADKCVHKTTYKLCS